MQRGGQRFGMGSAINGHGTRRGGSKAVTRGSRINGADAGARLFGGQRQEDALVLLGCAFDQRQGGGLAFLEVGR